MIRTPDIRLAAFLVARGHPFITAETNGRRVTFVIDAPETASRDYYGTEDTVSAKRLFESWRGLRNVIDAAVPK